MTTPPSPNPTPLPALAMVAALVFAVGAIATVFVFDRDPELFRSRGSTAVSHTRQGRRPTRLPPRRGTAWTGTASSCGGCPPKGSAATIERRCNQRCASYLYALRGRRVNSRSFCALL